VKVIHGASFWAARRRSAEQFALDLGGDPDRVRAVAGQIQAGRVAINGAPHDPAAPFVIAPMIHDFLDREAVAPAAKIVPVLAIMKCLGRPFSSSGDGATLARGLGSGRSGQSGTRP
jgi:hypothetical protein